MGGNAGRDVVFERRQRLNNLGDASGVTTKMSYVYDNELRETRMEVGENDFLASCLPNELTHCRISSASYRRDSPNELCNFAE